jgi:hypothetical protein
VKVLEKIRKEGGSARVVVTDDEGKPVVGLRWRAQLSDGSTIEGTTGADGAATVPAKPGTSPNLTFPDLDAAGWKER